MNTYPIIYDPYETKFRTHGKGVLTDAVSCQVSSDLKGKFTLELVYPISGRYLSELYDRAIIYADAGPGKGYQPFRICDMIKLSSGTVRVYANHITYDLSGIPVSAFSATSLKSAMEEISSRSAIENPFHFAITQDVEAEFESDVPKSARSCLLGEKGSIAAVYGGEFIFDHFSVKHSPALGANKGYRILYGVNLVDLVQERSCANVYTGVYPYFKDSETLLELPEKIMDVPNTTTLFRRILPLDLSSEFEETPQYADELREKTRDYLKENNVGAPTVSITLSHEQLSRYAEYSNIPTPEDLELGDTVYVGFERLGVSSSARVCSLIYDSIHKKYITVGIGDAKHTLINTLARMRAEERRTKNKSSGASRDAGAAKDTVDSNNSMIQLGFGVDSSGAPYMKGAAIIDAINAEKDLRISSERVDGVAGIVPPKAGAPGALEGKWTATPFSEQNAAPSEVVTRRDLINLGIIT